MKKKIIPITKPRPLSLRINGTKHTLKVTANIPDLKEMERVRKWLENAICWRKVQEVRKAMVISETSNKGI